MVVAAIPHPALDPTTTTTTSRFSAEHGFTKPNDHRALSVMNDAAIECMNAFPDILLAYGESDEMS